MKNAVKKKKQEEAIPQEKLQDEKRKTLLDELKETIKKRK